MLWLLMLMLMLLLLLLQLLALRMLASALLLLAPKIFCQRRTYDGEVLGSRCRCRNRVPGCVRCERDRCWTTRGGVIRRGLRGSGWGVSGRRRSRGR